MRALLFADGSYEIGAGHQVRSACLAAELRRRGHSILLAAHDLPGSSHVWAWRGLPQRLLPAYDPGNAGVHGLVAAERPDWLVVDCYRIADPWLAGLPPPVRSLLLDDAPGSRSLTRASVILNPNLAVEPGEYPPGSLVGPRFVPIRPAFRRAVRAPRPGEFLLLPGGTDAAGIAKVLAGEVLAHGAVRRLHYCGGDAPDDPRVVAHSGVDDADLAALMAGCQAGILAAGGAVYEALTVGLPFVAVQTAANQVRVADGLRAAKLADVYPADEASAAAARALELTAPSPRVCDGRGAERIAARLEEAG